MSSSAQPNRPALTVEERIDEILSSFYFDSCDEAMEAGVEHALSTDKWPSKDKAKQRLKRLVLEGAIEQTKLLQEAEKRFGKINWGYALRELDKDLNPEKYPEISAALREAVGGEEL